MSQAATTDLIDDPNIARPAGKRTASTPAIVIIEESGGLSGEFHHVFDYLDVRMLRVGSVAELRGALQTAAPMAVVWELSAGLDTGEVMHAVYDVDRDLPLMIIADAGGRTLALMDSMIRFWRMRGVSKLTRRPELREMVEFIFRAGRRSGEFRVLSV